MDNKEETNEEDVVDFEGLNDVVDDVVDDVVVDDDVVDDVAEDEVVDDGVEDEFNAEVDEVDDAVQEEVSEVDVARVVENVVNSFADVIEKLEEEYGVDRHMVLKRVAERSDAVVKDKIVSSGSGADTVVQAGGVVGSHNDHPSNNAEPGKA